MTEVLGIGELSGEGQKGGFEGSMDGFEGHF